MYMCENFSNALLFIFLKQQNLLRITCTSSAKASKNNNTKTNRVPYIGGTLQPKTRKKGGANRRPEKLEPIPQKTQTGLTKQKRLPSQHPLIFKCPIKMLIYYF